MAQKKSSEETVLAVRVLGRNGNSRLRLEGHGGRIRALLEKASSKRANTRQNNYVSAIELNQGGKYTVRIRASFGRRGWTLPAFFLASSFEGAIKKLEHSLQLLQRHEDRLWFWSVERSDDPNVAGELLEEFGLHLDRRGDFPNKAVSVSVPPERTISGLFPAALRRRLAESIVIGRALATTHRPQPSSGLRVNR